jgi:hypothetical protein
MPRHTKKYAFTYLMYFAIILIFSLSNFRYAASLFAFFLGDGQH